MSFNTGLFPWSATYIGAEGLVGVPGNCLPSDSPMLCCWLLTVGSIFYSIAIVVQVPYPVGDGALFLEGPNESAPNMFLFDRSLVGVDSLLYS